MFLESTKDFADRELFPYIKEMDEKPAYHKDGKVYVHSQVETMMKKGGELGFISASFDYDIGGMQIPLMAHTAAIYILDAANNHLPGYAGLTQSFSKKIHFANKKPVLDFQYAFRELGRNNVFNRTSSRKLIVRYSY